MRAVVQRVADARVRVEGEVVGSIGPGALVLVGVGHEDDGSTVERMAAKLRALRIFEGADGRMDEPLDEREILVVSQFTLMGSVARGNRPSFTDAAPPERARALYEGLCDTLGAERGVFGARMEIEMRGDGPVTIVLEI